MKPGRSLVSPDLFDRLVSRIVKERNTDRELAARIMDQALAFLGACACNHGTPLSPSPTVDIGWHTFLLHTKDYAEFCGQVAGRFLHHVPADENVERRDPAEVSRTTMEAIEAAGFVVDHELWDIGRRLCSQCFNGCADDPPPDPPPKDPKRR